MFRSSENWMAMKQVSYSEARQTLSSILSAVCDDFEEVYIARKNGDRAVILSADEYDAMKETVYLLSSKENAKHLQASLQNADDGNTKSWETLLDECGLNSAI
ncbi:type II toxin-antitoxin system prevent-host-death family antitoxin [bacterium]|nr:type II toxin-antitoxin system prevent-host-death family antitoxin [bacterium]